MFLNVKVVNFYLDYLLNEFHVVIIKLFDELPLKVLRTMVMIQNILFEFKIFMLHSYYFFTPRFHLYYLIFVNDLSPIR